MYTPMRISLYTISLREDRIPVGAMQPHNQLLSVLHLPATCFVDTQPSSSAQVPMCICSCCSEHLA